MPQEILDERQAKVDERIERRRGILGQDEPPLALRERGGPDRIREHRADPRQRHRHPLQLFALSVRAGYWGTGVGYALFEQAVGDRAASLRMLANNERAISFSTSGGGSAWTGGSTSTTRDSTRGWCGPGRRHPDHGHGLAHAALGNSAGQGVSRHVWRGQSGRPGS
jgi:hypothetical protein